MYIVAKCGDGEDAHRILKVELTTDLAFDAPLSEILFDDNRVYSKRDLQILLSTVHNGNKA